MLLRLSKTALVAASSLFFLLVVFNNLTDYGSNLAFVQHVLAMDSTFPGNKLMWRALTSPAIHHAFYASIILWELAAGLLLAATWQAAKSLAVAGLVLSLLQWFVAFITVGGEWFAMWQSNTWNGQNAAFRMFAVLGVILLFLNQRDDELSPA